MTDREWKDLGLSYLEALHAMQSAVLHDINIHGTGMTSGAGPKHLRVGINSAKVEHGALVNLLVKKGIITGEEYLEEIRLAMNNEVAMYEEKHKGVKFR